MNGQKLAPDYPILGLPDCTVSDFWSWAYSDILSNRNRSIFAEFLVAHALGVTNRLRVEWDAVDLTYKGKGIEVKSAGYVQSWAQTKPSLIVFDIGKKRSWDAGTNTYSKGPVRASDCYVFCLHDEKDKDKANVLNIATWRFFVIRTEEIGKVFGDQKTVSLSSIKTLTDEVDCSGLKEKIDEILG